jgi:NAD(P)H dehydrogenase (quinone)
MFGPDAIHGEVETMLRPILRGTLWYTGMQVLPPFYAWHVPYITAEARTTVLQDWRRWLLTLEQAKPLSFPRLDEFDDRLHPKRPAAQS